MKHLTLVEEQKPKVLFATSEITPLVKTGGLADVSAALPAALKNLGVDVRVLIPGYPQVFSSIKETQVVARMYDMARLEEFQLLSGQLPDSEIPLYIFNYPPFYSRPGGPYQDQAGKDWPDNAERFGMFSKIAAILSSSVSPLEWRPDVLHCNDWQTALAPAFLTFMDQPQATLGAGFSFPAKHITKARTLTTIHNLAFQGNFPPEWLIRLGLPTLSFSMHGLEYHGQLSFLKAGLFYANHLSTVSRTYAREIQTPELGFGMQGLLFNRRNDLTGIVNGIDTKQWNPATDAHIAQNYDLHSIEKKAANKAALQKRAQLHPDPNAPLFGVISRLTLQKGFDLLEPIIPQLMQAGAQLVMLGTGEAKLEQSFTDLAQAFPGKMGVTIGFDEPYSHLIEAGSDAFLMPSRFEPCGLNQMYSMRYGTLPIVHNTGGLADTVIDSTPYTVRNNTATGFVFRETTSAELWSAIERTIAAYRNEKVWIQLQRNAMQQDFSWRKSAKAYQALYTKLLKQPAAMAMV